jgi:hypothetical protein
MSVLARLNEIMRLPRFAGMEMEDVIVDLYDGQSLDRLTAERDALRAALDAKSLEANQLAVECDMAKRDRNRAEAERDTAIASLATARMDTIEECILDVKAYNDFLRQRFVTDGWPADHEAIVALRKLIERFRALIPPPPAAGPEVKK